jgi:hypothetical protein
MNLKKPLLVIVLLAVVLALAFAPAALAKGQTAPASGSWTWVGNEGGWDKTIPPQAPTPADKIHAILHGSETGWWTGTFTANETYEPFVAMFTTELDPFAAGFWAKLWIHFKDATVDMGGGVFLHGDMTMLVIFHTDTSLSEGATWKIQNGTGDLKYLGGAGTLVWTDTGMDYSGTIRYSK